MVKNQKKTGKGRLDKYYHLAKEQGYRARSAFKLIQLNKKYNFLENARVLIDLCAAPGGWLQVASKYMPVSSLIVGVDLVPIKPIPKVITFAEDITTDKCRSQLRGHLKTWKADVVLHDGAPNVGTAWVQDAFSQAQLVLMSLKLATEFLNKGGVFVTKVFRSKDYNNLLWVFNQLFKTVEATKPPSSRNVSAEIFVVCRGFLAPKRIDPKFLDPKAVFEELEILNVNTDSNVFHPEKFHRQRDGYEDGALTLHKSDSVTSFITAIDPVKVLGTVNQLTFRTEEEKGLLRHPSTTEDIKINLDDLKVLGKKDFRQLLKWRLSIRDHLGLDKKLEKDAAESVEVTPLEPVDEEAQIDDELERLSREEQARIRKERRKHNEKRTKTQMRMQLSMTTPTDIGLEQDGTEGGDENEGSLFHIRAVDPAKMETVLKSDMALADAPSERPVRRSEFDNNDDDMDSDDAHDALEDSLDQLYEDYKERKAEKDAKYRIRKMREQESEWKPAGDKVDESDDSEDEEDPDDLRTRVLKEEASSSDSDDDIAEATNAIIGVKRKRGADIKNQNTVVDVKKAKNLSKTASLFFSQPLFQNMADVLEEEEDQTLPEEDIEAATEVAELEVESSIEESADGDEADSEIAEEDVMQLDDESEEEDEDEDGFELVNADQDMDDEELWDGEESPDEAKRKAKKEDVALITAEAMTLAQQIVNRQKTVSDLMDDGFNKWAFRDKDGLPEWFIDEEGAYNKPNIPVTKEAVQAIRDRMRAVNARPIKKIAEAKARKKFKTAQRITKMQKKADTINEATDLTEKEKASSISKLLAKKAGKPKKKEVKVVVARGANKAISGRPKGTKGRYKMVDGRLKKETRALKRIAKAKAPKRRK